MTLTVAVQMDPLEDIGIAGDSTFALMLSAQAARIPMPSSVIYLIQNRKRLPNADRQC